MVICCWCRGCFVIAFGEIGSEILLLMFESRDFCLRLGYKKDRGRLS